VIVTIVGEYGKEVAIEDTVEKRIMVKIISIDFQKEFVSPEGRWANPGRSIPFIKRTLIPFCREYQQRVYEIISDYRQPRPGDSGDGCYPGTPGYESEIPQDIKSEDIWVKCMNSPIWTRENIGEANAEPGLPYQDPDQFTGWITRTVGQPDDVDFVTLIGLTADWCVLCTAQELSWRGYTVKILDEGTDVVNGDKKYKRQLFTKSPLLNWASVISWRELKGILE
jgi:nicotinamidase-related amidase